MLPEPRRTKPDAMPDRSWTTSPPTRPRLLVRVDETKARAEARTAASTGEADASPEAVDLFMRRISGDFDVKKAYLLGSFARGEASDDSDVDVAVVLGRRGDLSEPVLCFSDVAYDVFMETGVLGDAHPLWEDEWQTPSLSTNPFLVENIKRDGSGLVIEPRE